MCVIRKFILADLAHLLILLLNNLNYSFVGMYLRFLDVQVKEGERKKERTDIISKFSAASDEHFLWALWGLLKTKNEFYIYRRLNLLPKEQPRKIL